jgi:hypothetical protein
MGDCWRFLRQHRQRLDAALLAVMARKKLCLSPVSDADGADGMSLVCMDSDDPAAAVALTAKGDLDAKRP